MPTRVSNMPTYVCATTAVRFCWLWNSLEPQSSPKFNSMTRSLSRLPPLPLLFISQVGIASIFPTQFRSHHGRTRNRLIRMLWDPKGVSSNRNSVNGFRTYCSGGDLTIKKCVSCDSKDMRPMTEESANMLLPKVEGWNLVNENGTLKLNRSWKVKSFTKGLQLFDLVGKLAEEEGHHPDLHLVRWNNVTIEIWTHAVGGLTENDFILAAKINALQFHGLLRRKVSP